MCVYIYIYTYDYIYIERERERERDVAAFVYFESRRDLFCAAETSAAAAAEVLQQRSLL